VIPSGNLVATAHDAATFYQCLLDGEHATGSRPFDGGTIRRALEADRPGLDIDRRILLPLRYSAGFMLGTETMSLYGWNHPRAFGHIGLANSFTWADPDRELVVALLTTGKAVLGPHVPSLVQLITEIHRTFPEESPRYDAGRR
jgi:CubicO group peptidase (beta-lactamase class C family)